MSGRYPCTGTYTAGGSGGGGNSGGGGSAGTTDSCLSPTITEVQNSKYTDVATIPQARYEALMFTNGRFGTDLRFYIFGGYDANDDWQGSNLYVYNPNDGAVSEVALSSAIPQPSAVLGGGPWEYPMPNVIVDYNDGNGLASGIIYYNAFSPITEAYYIHPDTGQVETMSSKYANWGSPPETIDSALFKYVNHSAQYPRGILVIPDDDNGNRTHAFFFDLVGDAWYTLNFNATYSAGSVIFFNEDIASTGSFYSQTAVWVFDTSTAYVLEYFPYSTNAGDPPDEFFYVYRFNDTDPSATENSESTQYYDHWSTSLKAAAPIALYDPTTGDTTDTGDGIAMLGGDESNIWTNEYHFLENWDTGDRVTGSSYVSDSCPRISGSAIIVPTYDLETGRGVTLDGTADTSHDTDKILVLYIFGGKDLESGALQGPELRAVTLPFYDDVIAVH